MIEKAFLHLLYECEVRNINLPLDFVAHRMYPGATGDALRQRAERLRKELIAEGHLVPPKAGKKRTNLNPKVRGYIRKHPGDADNILETREVLFTEPLDDIEFNDPTGYQLVHNRQARSNISKAFQTAFNRKQVGSDDNSNVDSESSDEAEESDAEFIQQARSSARLLSLPKKYLKDESSECDQEDEYQRMCEERHKFESGFRGQANGNNILGGDLQLREAPITDDNKIRTQEMKSSIHNSLPKDVVAVGCTDLTPGNLGDEENNAYVRFSLSLMKP